jgi:hypothetical protein
MQESDRLDETPGDPNSDAYQKTETRTGPPLDYVAEKLRSSLEMLHATVRCIREIVPDDLPLPPGFKEFPDSVKQNWLVSPAWSAFRHGITAFCALQNMLALADDQEMFERLLGYSTEQFRDWLDNIEREGLVRG